MTATPEQLAYMAAAVAVRKIIAQSKNRRTLLGRARPTSVAWAAAYDAVLAHREVLAHEKARQNGGFCLECGRIP